VAVWILTVTLLRNKFQTTISCDALAELVTLPIKTRPEKEVDEALPSVLACSKQAEQGCVQDRRAARSLA
jgi:hypothetical protein